MVKIFSIHTGGHSSIPG